MRRETAVILAAILVPAAFVAGVLQQFAGRFDLGDIHDLAALVTVLSLVLSPTGYLFKVLYDRYRARGMASRNLYRELEDTLKSLDRSLFPDDAISFVRKDNGKKMYYMNRVFNRDFYESLVRSGGINFMATEHQQQVQDTFGKIKDHNDALEQIDRIVNETKEPFPVEAYHLYEWVARIEKELKEEIPDLLKKLERHFGL